MTWFAFIGYGHVFNLNGLAEKEMAGTGAHGYATEAQALQNPNSPLNGAQAALAQQFEAEAMLPFGASHLGVLQVDQVTQPKGTGTGGVGQSPSQAQQDIQGQQQVGGGLGSLFDLAFGWSGAKNFLWRAAKVVIGGVLLVGGLMHMTGTDKAACSARPRPGCRESRNEPPAGNCGGQDRRHAGPEPPAARLATAHRGCAARGLRVVA